MTEADLEEAALMVPEERLRLVFLLSGQLAEGGSVPREAWPVGVVRFGGSESQVSSYRRACSRFAWPFACDKGPRRLDRGRCRQP